MGEWGWGEVRGSEEWGSGGGERSGAVKSGGVGVGRGQGQ